VSDPTETDEQNPVESGERPAPAPDGESTVGTGTGIALGCIAITVILTLLGVLFLLALRWLG
jgi:hypothetical protein